MTDADRKALERELAAMRKSKIDHYTMDAMERSISHAIRAKNGLPKNERLVELGESLYWQSLGLLSFMCKTQQRIEEMAVAPQGRVERLLYFIKPIAFPLALVAIFSPHVKEIMEFIKTLCLIGR